MISNQSFGKIRTSKGSVSIWLIVLVVVTALATGYFVFQKSSPSAPEQSQNQPVVSEENNNQSAVKDETATGKLTETKNLGLSLSILKTG